jgi:hypothetical protein
MQKTYHGSCHCNAVQFECKLDLTEPTTRCNCRFCKKARFWIAFTKAENFRLTQGAEVLRDYQHTPEGRPEPFLHFQFCGNCGVRAFTKGGALPAFGGEFYAVNLASLDDASDAELAAAPIHYADGRGGDWQKEAANCRYL